MTRSRNDEERNHRREPVPNRTRLRRPLSVAAVGAVVAAGAGLLTGAARADEPEGSQRDGAEQPALTEPAREAHRPGRASLLREGSFLVQAAGTLQVDSHTGWWTYRLVDDGDAATDVDGHELLMLPNTLFQEMQRMVEAMPDQVITFEATGEVFVYHGRNFFLVTHAPELRSYDPPPDDEREAADETPDPPDEPAEDPADAPASPDDPEAGEESDDPVERVEEELERAVGALARSPRLGGGEDASSTDEAERQVFGEGELIVQRRGNIVRDSTGAWVFVFDADSSGLADPPLLLLPGQMLERIESQARRRGTPMAVLISGTVTSFQDRHYLMPTMYRMPSHHSNIQP